MNGFIQKSTANDYKFEMNPIYLLQQLDMK